MNDTRYEFIMMHADGTEVRVKGNKEGIIEMLEDYKSFLLACTYQPGNVDRIIYYEDNVEEDE